MRKRFWTGLVVPLAAIAISMGCSGDDGADRRDQRGMANAAEQQAGGSAQNPAATVEITGCLAGAPGGGHYALQNVWFQSDRRLDPHRDTTTPGPHGITQGSYVRLDAGDRADRMRQLAGQHVKVTGTIVDDGRNTIGTAGTGGHESPTGRPSHAAEPDQHPSQAVGQEMGRGARESMADGTAALVRVENIEQTGEPCPSDLVPSVR